MEAQDVLLVVAVVMAGLAIVALYFFPDPISPHYLAQSDGVKHPRRLIAVNGSVLDISGSQESYTLWAGHDVSVALVRQDATQLDADVAALSAEERQQLQAWEKKLRVKHSVVGRLARRKQD